jgi:hypothetical protein
MKERKKKKCQKEIERKRMKNEKEEDEEDEEKRKRTQKFQSIYHIPSHLSNPEGLDPYTGTTNTHVPYK